MKIYKSKKDSLITVLIIGLTLLPLVVFTLDIKYFTGNPVPLVILFLPCVILYWIYFDTYYVIDGQRLKYHSAFLRGEIEIDKIREIVKGQTIWVGIKPALARGGLIIRFNKYDDIYIAPVNNDIMISDLVEINPGIRVV